jgi:DNA-binding response OmpR family regulator
MDPLKRKNREGPEEKIREAIVHYLNQRGWVVNITHGSMFQSGFPDLYATHKKHGPRWIEVKLPEMKGSRWTSAQKHWFPLMSENGTPIWVLTAASDSEYKKLFEPENWWGYFFMKA